MVGSLISSLLNKKNNNKMKKNEKKELISWINNIFMNKLS